MQAAVTFNMYENIKVMLDYLGNGYLLNLNIRLGKEDKDKNRRSVYNEFFYNSNKYKGINTLATIKLDLSYFLTIDNTADRKSVMITSQDIYMFRLFIDSIVQNFLYNNDKIFSKDKDGNDIVLTSEFSGSSYRLINGEIITYKFILIDKENTHEYGLRISFANSEIVFDISMNNFFSVADKFAHTDFATLAMTVMSGILPELGTNHVSLSTEAMNARRNIIEQPPSGGTGRKPMMPGRGDLNSLL